MKRLYFPLFSVFAIIYALNMAQAASSSTPEYFWRAADGQFTLLPTLSYSRVQSEQSFYGISSKTTSTATQYGIGGEYGLTSNISLGASIGMLDSNSSYESSLGSTSTSKQEGLKDLTAYAKMEVPVSVGSLFFQVTTNLSLGKATYDVNAAKSSAQSGGWGIEPSVGYGFMPSSNVAMGGRLAYKILGERTQQVTNPVQDDRKTTGGNTTTAEFFLEIPTATFTPGFAVAYLTADATKTASTASESESSKYSVIGAEAYAALPLGSNFELAPKLIYGSLTVDSSDSNYQVKSVPIYAATLDARILF